MMGSGKQTAMKTLNLILLGWFCSAGLALPAGDALEAGFDHPPEQTKPWCYWYWISDNISREGITKDLEAMSRFGIGEALIGNIFLDNQPAGAVKVFSDDWWELVRHAFREADRVGVNIGLFNCPGWSQSGGPWIKPEQTMRYLAASEVRVTGPRKFSAQLATPNPQFQDVAVLAFPSPQHDADTLAAHAPRVTCTPSAANAEQLVDGNLDTAVALPLGKGAKSPPVTVDIELASPLTARTLQIIPADEPFGADAELQVQDEAGRFQTLRTFKCDRSNMAVGVGFMPRGPVTISFPATTSRQFRLVFSNFFGRGKQAKLAEINLTGAARLESFVEKQLAKMHPTPLPMWDTYLWPTQSEPDSTQCAVPVGEVTNLSSQLAADGTLTWDVPAGEWVIQRIGMTPTGMRNSPASPEGQGLEVDKMNRDLAKFHFEQFIGGIRSNAVAAGVERAPRGQRRPERALPVGSAPAGGRPRGGGLRGQLAGCVPSAWVGTVAGELRPLGFPRRVSQIRW